MLVCLMKYSRIKYVLLLEIEITESPLYIIEVLISSLWLKEFLYLIC